jgi:hypothetical protein
MNLNDLFEMGITDIPPALRRKLTPADVAPKTSPVAGSTTGKFRVVPTNSDFDIKDFDDQRSANEYAKLVGGKIQTLSEQEDLMTPGSSPRARGTRNIILIDKTKNTKEPVILDMGTAKYSLTDPEDKKWFLNVWYGMRKNNRGDRFLDMMGDEKGFEYLHDMFAAHHVQKQQQQQNRAQKKRNKTLGERNEGTPARTQRLLDKIRLQYPQAQNDQEAMVYAFMDYGKKNKAEIDKLEKQHDDLEKDVKNELEKSIGDLGTRRGAVNARLKQVSSTNVRQDELIKQLLKIDQEQQQALDDLKSTLGSTKGAGRSKVTVSPGEQPVDATPLPTPVIPAAPLPPIPSMTRADAAAAADAAVADVKASSAPEPEPEVKPEVKPMIDVPPKTSARPKSGKAQPALPLGQQQSTVKFSQPAANQSQGSLQKVAERIGIRGLGETKNKAVPDNKKLWEQALNTAQSKFDVFPSTHAKTWAAKWYNIHGGKWNKK